MVVARLACSPVDVAARPCGQRPSQQYVLPSLAVNAYTIATLPILNCFFGDSVLAKQAITNERAPFRTVPEVRRRDMCATRPSQVNLKLRRSLDKHLVDPSAEPSLSCLYCLLRRLFRHQKYRKMLNCRFDSLKTKTKGIERRAAGLEFVLSHV